MNHLELSIITSHLSLLEYIDIQCAMKTKLPFYHYATLTAYKNSVQECKVKDISQASRINVPVDNEILSYLVNTNQIEYLKQIPKLRHNIISNWELHNRMFDKMPDELILYLLKKCILI